RPNDCPLALRQYTASRRRRRRVSRTAAADCTSSRAQWFGRLTDTAASDRKRYSRLEREQSIAERSVSLWRDPEVFRRHAVASIPLMLEVRALTRISFGQALHHVRHQCIRLLDRGSGLIDEAGLDV